MIELLFLGSAAAVGGAHAVRQNRARHQPHGRRQRDSLLVKAWNSSGAPHTGETMLADALADLGGRAIGATVRHTAPRVARRTGQMREGATRRAGARWQRRTQEDRTVTFFRRRTPTGTGNNPEGAGRRAGNAPPLPLPAGPATPGPGTPGSATGGPRPPSPPPTRPSSPSSPPPASPSSPSSSRSPFPFPPAPRSTSGGGRGGRGRRTHARMRVAGPLDLEVPGTDVEFLDTCAELQQILRGVAVAVADWSDEVAAMRLPPIVTVPLGSVDEGLVDAAACTALATLLFEAWFAEARGIAASGIEFSGEDPE